MKDSPGFQNIIGRFGSVLSLAAVGVLAACTDNSVIYEQGSEAVGRSPIQLQGVRVASATSDRLMLDVTYTYDHEIPAEEVKLFVMPDHGYWSTRGAAVSRGTNTARISIGLSRSNMEEDGVTESDTSTLRFRFEHYQPEKYLGSIWGIDVPYEKHWELD